MSSFENVLWGKSATKARESAEVVYGNPYEEAFVKTFHDAFAGTENEKTLELNFREIIRAFFKEETRNIHLEPSEKFGVKFPVTSISLSDLVGRLYKTDVPLQPEAARPTASEKVVHQKYLFGSIIDVDTGSALEFVEIVINDMLQRLPRALADIKKGIQPEEFKVTTFGFPMNAVGTVNEAFTENIKADSVGTLAELFGEYIEKDLQTLPKEAHRYIEFHGMSMGGGIAAKAGEVVLDKKDAEGNSIATQGNERNVPRLSIRAESPVALGPSWIKPVQIRAGAVLDAVGEYVTSKTGTFGMGTYIGNLMGAPKEFDERVKQRQQLGRQDLPKNISTEQLRLKQEAIQATISGLSNGVSLRPGVKVTELYGLKDVATLTPGILADASEFNTRRGIGKNMLSRPNPDTRRVAVDMMHLQPHDRPNKLEKMKRAAEALADVRAG